MRGAFPTRRNAEPPRHRLAILAWWGRRFHFRRSASWGHWMKSLLSQIDWGFYVFTAFLGAGMLALFWMCIGIVLIVIAGIGSPIAVAKFQLTGDVTADTIQSIRIHESEIAVDIGEFKTIRTAEVICRKAGHVVWADAGPPSDSGQDDGVYVYTSTICADKYAFHERVGQFGFLAGVWRHNNYESSVLAYIFSVASCLLFVTIGLIVLGRLVTVIHTAVTTIPDNQVRVVEKLRSAGVEVGEDDLEVKLHALIDALSEITICIACLLAVIMLSCLIENYGIRLGDGCSLYHMSLAAGAGIIVIAILAILPIPELVISYRRQQLARPILSVRYSFAKLVFVVVAVATLARSVYTALRGQQGDPGVLEVFYQLLQSLI